MKYVNREGKTCRVLSGARQNRNMCEFIYHANIQLSEVGDTLTFDY